METMILSNSCKSKTTKNGLSDQWGNYQSVWDVTAWIVSKTGCTFLKSGVKVECPSNKIDNFCKKIISLCFC